MVLKRAVAIQGEFEALSEDDLDLVEQNTGVRIERPEIVSPDMLTSRLWKRSSTYKQKRVKKLKRAGATEDSEEEVDNDVVHDLARLFDDTSASRRDKNKGKRTAETDTNLLAKANRALDMDDLEDDMADFIEEDSPDEGDADARENRAKKKRQEKAAKRRKTTGFSLGGLDITAEYVLCYSRHPSI